MFRNGAVLSLYASMSGVKKGVKCQVKVKESDQRVLVIE